MRQPFLLLGPTCVSVGMGTACWQTGSLRWTEAILILAGAVASHGCVNSANEYFDFESGLDAKTERTPLRGGSGTLQAHPGLDTAALGVAIGSFAAMWGRVFRKERTTA